MKLGLNKCVTNFDYHILVIFHSTETNCKVQVLREQEQVDGTIVVANNLQEIETNIVEVVV